MKRKVKKNKKIGRERAAFPIRFLVCGIFIALQIILSFCLAEALGEWFIFSQMAQTIFGVSVLIFLLNKDEPAAHKMPWIVVLLILPLFGALLYCMFGNPQQTISAKKRFGEVNRDCTLYLKADRSTMEKLKDKSADGAALAEYVQNVCHFPVFEGTKTEYFACGELFFEKLIDDIKHAKRYIFMEYFIITPGEIWNRIHDALVERVMNGVDVYILYDDIGSMKKTPAAFDSELRAEGIFCYKFNKISPIVTTLHNNRDHRKITVIDGKIAYTGGVNIADEYANIEKPFGVWKDSAVRLYGAAVYGFVFMFTQLYNVFAAKMINPADFLAELEDVPGDGFVQPYCDGPRPLYNDYIGKNIYLSMIYSAKKYIYIASPYLICGYEVEEALIFAAKRGVDVRIITPHIPDKKSVFAMTRSAYAKLIRGGVNIYEFAPGFIHSKIVITDDEICALGTVNFDYRSFVHHYECGVLITCANVLKTVKQDLLDTILKNSVMQTEQSAKLSFWEKIIKTIMGLFAPLL